MAEESLKQLRARASLSLRNGDFDTALAAYRSLAKREPKNPLWSQRRAEIYLQLGRNTQAMKGFEHALDIAINGGEILAAIAVCKQILEIDPDHDEALDRLHLLYSEPAGPSAMSAQPSNDVGAVHEVEPPLDDAPLEEVLLTETIPGASPHTTSRPDESGIMEIPLVEPAAPKADGRDAAVIGAREQLLATPLFGSLDASGLRAVVEQVQLVSLDEGDVLFRQGDPADTLYVVAEGAVVPIAEEIPRKKLAVLETGSFFGEIGLLADMPRNATIEALVDSRLLAIDRKAMWRILKKHRSVLQVMLRFLRDRLVDRLIRTNPLFSAFPAQHRAAVARLFQFLEVRKGGTLIEQGRPSEGLFALLAGRAEVIQMDIASDQVLAELVPGELFGEMSLLTDSPARATVTTKTKCWVLTLGRDKLERLIEKNPELREFIRGLTSDREIANLGLGQRPGSESGALEP
ncbi:MAG: cyclic nucleotide-binding domain-containing protein [Myxococcota bacterium]|jgi:CRP-like cAMP-binding protein|nr:cyclic nucleotide-binding domain-containing protein [Myxococcota bacterium]